MLDAPALLAAAGAIALLLVVLALLIARRARATRAVQVPSSFLVMPAVTEPTAPRRLAHGSVAPPIVEAARATAAATPSERRKPSLRPSHPR